MKYIKFTYIDAVTGISVGTFPATNGPKFPEIDDLEFKWEKLSKRPTQVPEFFGVCSDSSDTNVEGVLSVFTKEEYDRLYNQELTFQKVGPQIVSAKQIRLRLLKLSLLDRAIEVIKNLPQELQIEWNYSLELAKEGNLIIALTNSLELTPTTLNEIFMDEQEYLDLIARREEDQLIQSEQL